MSLHKKNSDVSRINILSGGDFYTPSSETLYVIKEGLKFSEMSNGKFDLTIGPLVSLWGIGNKDFVPEIGKIKDALDRVDYAKLVISGSGVKLLNTGMALDLGGIAKGYSSDRVREYLLSLGVKSALINLGGNIDVIGNKPDGSLWNIGIQHPRKKRGEYIGVIPISNSSFVSSGDYERFFIKDGVRYHHILDTKTGYPRVGEVISSSITSTKGIYGDAISTITFGLTIEEIKELGRKIEFEGVFVTEDFRVYVTKNLRDKFTLNDDRYRLIYD